MFVPPPVPTLSKAEIESRRARLSAEAKLTKDRTSATSDQSNEQNVVSNISPSETPMTLIRKIGIFGSPKDDNQKINISAPIVTTPPTSRFQASPNTASERKERRPQHQAFVDFVKTLPPPPLPPVRPLPSPVTQSPDDRRNASEAASDTTLGTLSSATPPRRPPRPPRGLSIEPGSATPPKQDSPAKSLSGQWTPGSSIKSSSKHKRGSSGSLQHGNVFSLMRRSSSDRSAHSLASSASSQALRAGTQAGRVKKSPQKRSNVSASVDAEADALMNLIKPKRANKSVSVRTIQQETSFLAAAVPGLASVPSKSKRTAPELSIKSIPYASRSHPVGVEVYQDKALPATPSSILKTPREMYGMDDRGPSHMRMAVSRHSVVVGDLSSQKLTMIPENAVTSKATPPNSGVTTPVKTLHLRGGSVVTVSRPEINAWQQSVYIQGPIRLSKPSIVPRKNSLASLEPFQEAVDQVYQDALSSSRRRSDEAAAKEICSFFIEFGTCDVYEYDENLPVNEGACGQMEEVDPDEEIPDSPMIMLTALSPAALMPVLELPPVETAEDLRARGIARLRKGHQSTSKQTEAAVKPEADSVLTLVAMPEDSILDAVLASSDSCASLDEKPPATGLTNLDESSAPWISSGKNYSRAASILKRYSQ